MENKSVFEMILSGDIESDIIYEDNQIFAIHDINPVAKVHILIIPKKKIATINDLTKELSKLEELDSTKNDENIVRKVNQSISSVSKHLDKFEFNTAVSDLMKLNNDLSE